MPCFLSRVEYFGQRMQGFVFTEHGWVQSYGSRYVRPPIIHGDVSRPKAMTVKEFQYAQSLTQKPVKGMLTGESAKLALQHTSAVKLWLWYQLKLQTKILLNLNGGRCILSNWYY